MRRRRGCWRKASKVSPLHSSSGSDMLLDPRLVPLREFDDLHSSPMTATVLSLARVLILAAYVGNHDRLGTAAYHVADDRALHGLLVAGGRLLVHGVRGHVRVEL